MGVIHVDSMKSRPFGSEYSLDGILEEVKAMGGPPSEDTKADTSPAKLWSAGDIDRLLAETGCQKEEARPPAVAPTAPRLHIVRAAYEYAEADETPAADEYPDVRETIARIEAEVQPEPASPVTTDRRMSSLIKKYDNAEEPGEQPDEPEPAPPEAFTSPAYEQANAGEPEQPKEPEKSFAAAFASPSKDEAAPPAAEKAPAPSPEPGPEGGLNEQSQTKTIRFAPGSIFERLKTAPVKYSEDIAPLTDDFAGGMETDELRRRFLNSLDFEKTAEQEIYKVGEPIEKPGVVIEKRPGSKTADLEPMPTVIPAEEVLRASRLNEEKTKADRNTARHNAAAREEAVEGQIALTGFDSGEPKAEKVNESSIEDALMARRSEKVRKFRLIGIPDEDNPDRPIEWDFESSEKTELEDEPKEENKRLEYLFPEQKNRIYTSFKKAAQKSTFSSAILTGIVIAYVALALLPKAFEWMSIDTAAFAADGKGIAAVSLVLLAASAVLNLPCMIAGFKSLFKLKPGCDTGPSLAVTAAAVHNILALALPAGGKTAAVFSAAAAFILLLNSLGRRFSLASALGNFEFCAFKKPDSLYCVSEIENNNEAFEIGRGILMGNPEILYSGKTAFPSEFVENSRGNGLADTVCGRMLPVAATAAALIGVIAGVLAKDFMTGFGAFTAAMCLGVPAGAALASWVALRSANKKLNLSGAMVANWDAAEECGRGNAIVIDSADLFDRANCGMYGMKEFGNIRVDDVLLYAAAMIIKSNGPLTDAFDKVIVGRRELLPPVKNLAYEERLGLAGWIHGQKVLLGNRNLMVNHNIEVPPKSSEERYKHDGRKVMYVAIANKLAALFVVDYAPDEALKPYIERLEDNGMQLLVRTCDPNITDDLLCDSFGIPVNGVKVIGVLAGRIFKRYRDKVRQTAPARVLHDGTSYSLFKAVAASAALSSGIRAAQVIQIIGAGLGLMGLLVLVFLTREQLAAPLYVILFQAFWAAVSIAAGQLKKIK